jgi:arylsulfatase A-like enzyme
MEKLRQLKLDQNTLVVFTSDHGDMLEFDEAVFPKQYPHDYSCRIPFMVRWPGKLEAGTTTGLLFSALDMMPSILGLMGLEVPKECHGKNLAKAIRTHDEEAVDYIPIWLYEANNFRGVITREYTFSTKKGATEASLHSVLFDRKSDPFQLTNRFDDPTMAAVKEKLWNQTKEWMVKYHDQFWQQADFQQAASQEEWNNPPYIRPVDVLKP